jgi:transcriptional regulator
MYIPRRYQETDRPQILSFIRGNSFGILVTVQDNLPVATHIPFSVEKNSAGEDVLVAHISKGNEQKRSLENGAQVLCIFTGPHAYISPRWYTEMNVPTWNYISVHVYGTLRLMEGAELKSALARLVDHFEAHMPAPVNMEEIPEKTLYDDMRGIIGFEIRIDDLQAAAKLSQNRDAESYQSVIAHLEAGDPASVLVAEAMREKSIVSRKETPGGTGTG